MAKGPVKKVAPVPEHVLKKRKAQETIKAAQQAKLVTDKKASKIERKSIIDKAASYDKEYKIAARDIVEKRRAAKKTNNFYMEPEPKLMLVVRIRGINAVEPKTKKILQLMRLRKVINRLTCLQYISTCSWFRAFFLALLPVQYACFSVGSACGNFLHKTRQIETSTTSSQIWKRS